MTFHSIQRKVEYLIGIGCLVVESETDRVREWPLEQGVVFTGQDFDVNRHVRSFTRSVAVEKKRSLDHTDQKRFVNMESNQITVGFRLPAACNRTDSCRKER